MKLLIEEGLSITEVARRLGCSRQTIYNNKDREIDEAEPRRRPSKLDEFRKYIEMRLERFDLPATVLLREIREQGYEGGITILRKAVAEIKDRHVQKVVDRFETEPGRQAQVDWGSCGTIWHEGRRRRLSLLVVMLGYSRTIWARFVVSERRPVLTTLLEQAFSELGGVPRELLFDNLKAVIARPRSEDTPAVVQPGFADFADHWGFEACACPPYWPRAKGKVERAVGYVKTSFLEGRSFDDLEDLNAQLRVWLATVANVRRHGTTGERPVDRLAAEQTKMLDLVTPYPKNEVEKRLADWDSRISFRGVRYSVDPSILGARRGTPVEVHLGSDERLRIHHEGRLKGTGFTHLYILGKIRLGVGDAETTAGVCRGRDLPCVQPSDARREGLCRGPGSGTTSRRHARRERSRWSGRLGVVHSGQPLSSRRAVWVGSSVADHGKHPHPGQ